MKKIKLLKVSLLSLFLLSGSLLFSCKKNTVNISILSSSMVSSSSSRVSLPTFSSRILKINCDDHCAVEDVKRGDYLKLVFTAPETKVYYFYALGSPNMLVDAFPTLAGFSGKGTICTFQGGIKFNDEPSASVSSQGCAFSLLVQQDDTIYFRVRNGQEYNKCKWMRFLALSSWRESSGPIDFPNN